MFTAVEAVPSNTEGSGRSPKEISEQSSKIVEECQEKCRAQFCSPEEEKRLLNTCREKCIGLCQI